MKERRFYVQLWVLGCVWWGCVSALHAYPIEDSVQSPADSLVAQEALMWDGDTLQTFPLYLDTTAPGWSLAECIRYAQEQNLEATNSRLEEERMQSVITRSWWRYAPEIGAHATAGLSLGRAIDYGSNTVSNDLFSTSFSISGRLTLFDGLTRLRSLQVARLDLQAQRTHTERVCYNTALRVAQSYLQILFQLEMVRVKQHQVQVSQDRLHEFSILVRSGERTEGELREMEAQVAEDEQQMVEARNALDLAVVVLRQQMMLQDDKPFNIVKPNVDSADLPTLPLESPLTIYEMALSTHPSISEMQYHTERARRHVQMAHAGYMPTLSLSASYGSGTRHFLEKNTLRPEDDFSTQFRDNASQNISLSLSIPIFDGLSTCTQVSQARIAYKQAELAEESTRNVLFEEVQRAYTSAVAAYRRYQSASLFLQAQSQAYEWAEVRIRLGAITEFEFQTVKNRYALSESTYLQAKYDYILKVKILRYYMGEPFEM